MISTWFTMLDFWVQVMEPEKIGTEDMPEVQALFVFILICFWLNIHMVDGILSKDLPGRLLRKGLLKMMFVCVFLQVIHRRPRYQALRTITHFHTFPGFFPTTFLNKIDNYCLFVFLCVLFIFLHTYIYIIIQHAKNHTQICGIKTYDPVYI